MSETQTKTYTNMGYTYTYEQKSHKGLWITLGCIAAFLLLCVFTNPKASKHREAFSEVLSVSVKTAVNQQLAEDEMGAFAQLLVNAVVDPLAGYASDVNTDYHNYIIFSTTSSENGYTFTFGILGKVFTISESKLTDYIVKAMNEQELD